MNAASAPTPFRAMAVSGGYRALLALPAGYDADPARRWPLLVFLHGTAAWGGDLRAITQQGPARLLAGLAGNPAPITGTTESLPLSAAERSAGEILARDFIVVAPQCPYYEVWNDGAILALLDQVSREFPVDATRVYLTGLSLGGFGAWSLAMRFPQRFTALVAVCGGGRVADIAASARHRPDALQRLGVWAFHGARDPVVPLAESARMIEALEAAGVREARLTVYPEAWHDAWTETYANGEIYAWLLRQAR